MASRHDTSSDDDGDLAGEKRRRCDSSDSDDDGASDQGCPVYASEADSLPELIDEGASKGDQQPHADSEPRKRAKKATKKDRKDRKKEKKREKKEKKKTEKKKKEKKMMKRQKRRAEKDSDESSSYDMESEGKIDHSEKSEIDNTAPPAQSALSFFEQLNAREEKKGSVGTLHNTVVTHVEEEKPKNNHWECPKCSSKNLRGAPNCHKCGALKRISLYNGGGGQMTAM